MKIRVIVLVASLLVGGCEGLFKCHPPEYGFVVCCNTMTGACERVRVK